jgi:hypothetical protein
MITIVVTTIAPVVLTSQPLAIVFCRIVRLAGHASLALGWRIPSFRCSCSFLSLS